MGREIKFRVWKKSESRMLYWNELLENPSDLCDALTKVKYESIMQYTGLMDKNGREVYEGDILQDTLDKIWIVYWAKGGFNLINKEYHCEDIAYMNLTANELSNIQNQSWLRDTSEIIGNIHDSINNKTLREE